MAHRGRRRVVVGHRARAVTEINNIDRGGMVVGPVGKVKTHIDRTTLQGISSGSGPNSRVGDVGHHVGFRICASIESGDGVRQVPDVDPAVDVYEAIGFGRTAVIGRAITPVYEIAGIVVGR